ncbi:hypothetical protein ACN47E_004829 [Coniothyrium glycines]
MSKIVKIFGYSVEKLPPIFRTALDTYMKNGAVKKVGEIDSVEIKTRGDESPVHTSHFNRKDKEKVLSIRVKPVDKSKITLTHHVYSDGTGTLKMGDKREFSSATGRRE